MRFGQTAGIHKSVALVVAVLLLAAACASDDDPGNTADPVVTIAPVSAASADGLAAEVALSESSSLVGHLVIDTDVMSVPGVTVVGLERTFSIPVATSSEHHELPVAGLRADSDYTITVSTSENSVDLSLRTGSLPDEFPSFDIAVSEPDQMSAGFTIFNLIDNTNQFAEPDPANPPRDGYLVVVDHEGEIVWYLRTDHAIGDIRQDADGTLLHEYNDTGARRIDLYGRTIEEWGGLIISGPLKLDAFGRQVVGDDSIEVATDAMHHELSALPNGNLLTISAERHIYEGFPAEGLCDEPDGIDGSYELISDVIVEFTPEGDIVAKYPLADYLDPVGDPRDQNVCGLPLPQVFPNWLYWAQGFTDAKDWTHANAVVLDPTGEYLTVSVRHLDAVLQIERATGDLMWRFGPDGDFAIDDAADYSYHQHAPEWQDDGTLLIYDNGNGRPGTGIPDPDSGVLPPFTRAVQYELDPASGSAEVVWEYTPEIDGRSIFAPFVGDADRLDNGNVLITNGGLGADREDGVTAQVLEVVPDSDGEGGETVFELHVAEPGKAFIVYRSERIASFYPE
jgi:hypothetical protein